MKFTEHEKNVILKAFTKVLIEAKGKGPRNIYLKFYDTEMHIIMHGVLSSFEKYLIQNFGQEAIDTFEDFYQRDCYNAELRFKSMMDDYCPFNFKKLISDFRNDVFVYVMKLNHD